MTSITVGTSGFDAMFASVRKQVEAKWSRFQDAAIEGAQFGAKTAQSYTASRPGATTGKAGRVDTGAMIAALRSELVSFSPREIHAQYGFVDEYEEYMRLQTVTGFTHNRSGDKIEPTFALRDSIGPTNAFTRDVAGRV